MLNRYRDRFDLYGEMLLLEIVLVLIRFYRNLFGELRLLLWQLFQLNNFHDSLLFLQYDVRPSDVLELAKRRRGGKPCMFNARSGVLAISKAYNCYKFIMP